jgi:hypothetical protein
MLSVGLIDFSPSSSSIGTVSGKKYVFKIIL